ncbi:MAG TPA: hypothetical protein VFA32_13155 [Dehalococcoidia bacterium]|nr:hypothetical protein [Dehalococcoidia bacterium]
MIEAMVARARRREKKLPKMRCGTGSRIQLFQAVLVTAPKPPRMAMNSNSEATASWLGIPTKKGIKAMGIHIIWAGIQLSRAIAFRHRNFSTRKMAGICSGWVMKEMAARMPIWKLLAPKIRA